MRPLTFVPPVKPTQTSTSDAYSYEWKVRLDNGEKARCVVRIPRRVADLAWNEPGFCGTAVVEAVKTHGMSVVERMVLRHDDPPLSWVVEATDVHADSARPRE
jgi:hypothetical protein